MNLSLENKIKIYLNLNHIKRKFIFGQDGEQRFPMHYSLYFYLLFCVCSVSLLSIQDEPLQRV